MPVKLTIFAPLAFKYVNPLKSLTNMSPVGLLIALRITFSKFISVKFTTVFGSIVAVAVAVIVAVAVAVAVIVAVAVAVNIIVDVNVGVAVNVIVAVATGVLDSILAVIVGVFISVTACVGDAGSAGLSFFPQLIIAIVTNTHNTNIPINTFDFFIFYPPLFVFCILTFYFFIILSYFFLMSKKNLWRYPENSKVFNINKMTKHLIYRIYSQ
jgi:hypothetical protein